VQTRFIPPCILCATVIALSKETAILRQLYGIALNTQRLRKCYNKVCILVSVAMLTVIVNCYLKLISKRTFLCFFTSVDREVSGQPPWK